MVKYLKYLFGLTVLGLILSCSDDRTENPIPNPPLPEPNNPIVKITTPQFVFGFVGEKRYAYAPSSLEQEDGSIHMWFCGNPNNTEIIDNIFHVKINPDGTKTTAKSVLQPTPGHWDSHHICDPAVVEGSFLWNNTTYKYAMFYLTNPYSYYYNEIGMAFSNDLNADSWIKYPDQIVRKTWSEEGDQDMGGGWLAWGVGQPSIVSLDGNGKLLLTYTVGDINGTRIVSSEADFSDMANYTINTPQTIVENGLYAIDNISRDYTANSQFAINVEADKIVMMRPVQPNPTEYPWKINSSLEIDYMNLSDFMNQTGSWTPIKRITPKDTGHPRNHNATLLTNNFGHIENWKEPTFYFTVSKAAPDVQNSNNNIAEWTYHIWRSKVEVIIP